jgi:hypothetical protein
MINDQREIYRPAAPTSQMGVHNPEGGRPQPTKLETDGVVIEIHPGDAVILTFMGDVTVSTRVGQAMRGSLPLCRTQATVRLDPPSNARATEIGFQMR